MVITQEILDSFADSGEPWRKCPNNLGDATGARGSTSTMLAFADLVMRLGTNASTSTTYMDRRSNLRLSHVRFPERSGSSQQIGKNGRIGATHREDGQTPPDRPMRNLRESAQRPRRTKRTSTRSRRNNMEHFHWIHPGSPQCRQFCQQMLRLGVHRQ